MDYSTTGWSRRARRTIARHQLHRGTSPRTVHERRGAACSLNGWQLSGENAFVTGDGRRSSSRRRTTSTSPAATAARAATSAASLPAIVRPVMDGDPMAERRRSADRLVRHVGVQAAGRPRRLRQRAAQRRAAARASTTGTSRCSRTSPSAAAASFQFRCEIYNVLNTVQFIDIDRARGLRRAGGPDQRELRDGARHSIADRAAAHDADVGAVQFLERGA